MIKMSENFKLNAEPPLGVGNTLLPHHHHHHHQYHRRSIGELNPSISSISGHWGGAGGSSDHIDHHTSGSNPILPMCCTTSMGNDDGEKSPGHQVFEDFQLNSNKSSSNNNSTILGSSSNNSNNDFCCSPSTSPSAQVMVSTLNLGSSTNSPSPSCSTLIIRQIPIPDSPSQSQFQIGPFQIPCKSAEESYKQMCDSNDLKDAIEMLLQLYKLFGSNVQNDELNNFVEYYTEVILRLVPPPPVALPISGSFVQADLFSCPICYGVMREPVTIQCGHSYCRRCITKQCAGQLCHRCKYILTQVDISNIKTNVLIGSLVEKWWANELRTEIKENLVQQEQIEEEVASRTNSWSSPLSLIKSEKALGDAEETIKACPYWAKGYFRKSITLAAIGKYEDAFISLSICLYLVNGLKLCDQSSLIPVKSEMVKVLNRLFISAMGSPHGSGGSGGSRESYRRHSFDQIQFSPYPNPKKQFLSSLSLKQQKDQQRFGSGGNFGSNSESENNSSGDESSERSNYSIPSPNNSSPTKSSILRPMSKYRYGHYNKSSNNNNCTSTNHQGCFEMQTEKIHMLFDRSFQELNKLHGEILDLRSSLAGKTGHDIGPNLSLRSFDETLISTMDFECTLCYRLFYQPVTTTCGHTYCRSCLERSLDHSPYCPLCKSSLEEYLAVRRHSIDEFIEIAISKYLPKERSERFQQHIEEVSAVALNGKNPELEIPIFVCTMAFPTVPCPLHVFEPRYRLMIRRCMESGTRRFGMCCYVHDGDSNYGEYGTILEIKKVQYFPDGRSVVDTIGGKRFRILRKGVRDGYNTAVIEYLEDQIIQESFERQQLLEIQEQVYCEASDWLKTVNSAIQQRIFSHFGYMPEMNPTDIDREDGPAWTWWLLAILPLETKAQLAVLSMNSLKKRLESIQKVLKYVKSSQI